MRRKRRTVSYPTPAEGDPDLADMLVELRSCKGSPYWNRSLSDIGGMILLDAAQSEAEKYRRQDRSTDSDNVGSR